jgi:hypothetical protein
MKITSFLLLTSMIVMLTGCPKKLYSTRPSSDLERNKFLKQVNDFLEDRQKAYYCAINGGTVTFDYSSLKYGCNSTAVISSSPTPSASPTPNTFSSVAASTSNNEALARRIRNEVIEKGVTAIDSVYNGFIDDLNTGRATTNFIADVIDLGVGAAVGITKGERPLQILGVALTAFRGGRKSVDVNFFREQTVPILVNKMDDNRAKIYNEIIQKRDNNKDKPVTDYPMEEVIKDIVRYFNAGTLIRAFAELSKDTAVAARNNENEVRILKGVTPRTVATQEDVVTSVNAFGVLNKLAKEASATSSPQSAKTVALAKLQKIAEAIQNNKSITDELNKDETLKSLLGNLKTNAGDGVKLANTLNDLRYEADGKIKIETSKAIDKIIIDNGN